MNMQIVINITEEDYEKIRETSFVENTEIVFKQSSEDRKGTMMLFKVIDAIKNGTPLPKGHGDLIDRSKIYKAIPAEEDNCTGVGMTLDEMDAYNDGIDAMYSLVHGAPTIIEADKGGEK